MLKQYLSLPLGDSFSRVERWYARDSVNAIAQLWKSYFAGQSALIYSSGSHCVKVAQNFRRSGSIFPELRLILTRIIQSRSRGNVCIQSLYVQSFLQSCYYTYDIPLNSTMSNSSLDRNLKNSGKQRDRPCVFEKHCACPAVFPLFFFTILF